MIKSMTREQITETIFRVLSEYDIPGQQRESEWEIPVEVSARHVHLTEEAIERLFGPGAGLTADRALSQPGQFLSKERVALVTQKGRIDQVAVLGPARPAVQVELSATDCRQLGIQAPVRLSGELVDAADIYLVGPAGILEARKSVIVARAHIHIPTQRAEQAGIRDGEEVSVSIGRGRRITLEQVICRVSDQAGLVMHIDFDEANACLLPKNSTARVRKRKGMGQTIRSREEEKTEENQKREPENLLITENGQSLLIGGKLITESVARKLADRAGRELTIDRGIILTPSAKDFLRHVGVTVVRQGGHGI